MKYLAAPDFVILWIFMIGSTGVFAATANGQNRADNFSLKDQNDQTVDVRFPSDKPVVLIFGDRKGAGQIEGWSHPIYKKYGNEIYVFGIASLSGVPSYARGVVRRLIKRQTTYSVLLDWGGGVSKNFAYTAGKALVVVVAKNGEIVLSRSGAVSNGELNNIYSEINKSL